MNWRYPSQQYPLRLCYMYENQLCTVIDVDDRAQHVIIKNFVTDPVFVRLGKTKHPTYKEYEEFLESRCFPRTRDKMKIMLQATESSVLLIHL